MRKWVPGRFVPFRGHFQAPSIDFSQTNRLAPDAGNFLEPYFAILQFWALNMKIDVHARQKTSFKNAVRVIAIATKPVFKKLVKLNDLFRNRVVVFVL